MRVALWVAFLLRDRQLLFDFHGVRGGRVEATAGVDMGNGVNVFLFCLALDPLLWALCSVPSLYLPSGYVDDLSAGATTRRSTRSCASSASRSGAGVR